MKILKLKNREIRIYSLVLFNIGMEDPDESISELEKQKTNKQTNKQKQQKAFNLKNRLKTD